MLESVYDVFQFSADVRPGPVRGHVATRGKLPLAAAATPSARYQLPLGPRPHDATPRFDQATASLLPRSQGEKNYRFWRGRHERTLR